MATRFPTFRRMELSGTSPSHWSRANTRSWLLARIAAEARPNNKSRLWCLNKLRNSLFRRFANSGKGRQKRVRAANFALRKKCADNEVGSYSAKYFFDRSSSE